MSENEARVRPVWLCFSGRIKSGKTTMSTAIAAALGWPMVSFGDHVRAIARDRGLAQSRTTLQELGEQLAEQDPKRFCEDVIAQANAEPGSPIVIDGIRHVHILEQLRDLAQPLPCKLALIQTHDQERHSRLAIEEAHQLSTIEAHSTEIQVSSSLLEHADIMVDGAQELEMALNIILMWLTET